MLKKSLIRLTLAWVAGCFFSASVGYAQTWRVGAARGDVTFLSQGRAMMGYGDFEQKTSGIESPLFSRAFFIESGQSRVAIVVVDLCMVLSHIKNAVLEELNQVSPKKWSWSDILILATHTHSGPGGYAQHDIYNVTGLGFDQKNFRVIVSGIRDSILEAEKRAVEGRVLVAKGELRGASINRSVEPYLSNADARLYHDQVDPTHYVFRFESLDQNPIGMLDFFAVHTTSMSRVNRLISSDNKGHAAQKVERHFGGDFVAGFANSNEGDASPNIFKGSALEKDLSDYEKTERVASLQVAHALELWGKSRELSPREISVAHTWVRMPDLGCEPAMGESFAAGADDGPSNLPGFYEGMRQDEFRPLPFFARVIVKSLQLSLGSSEGDPVCQFPKPILFAGDEKHQRILPRTIPFHLVQLSDVLFVGTPAEVTTMAGRRLRDFLAHRSKQLGVQEIVLGGLANDYSGYVTTPEEYRFQHYEGAHTLYGEKTFSIYLQKFSELLEQLSRGERESGQKPVFFRPMRDQLRPAAIDGAWPREKPGKVLRQPEDRVTNRNPIEFSFRSGLPSRFSEPHSKAFLMESLQDGKWVRVDLPVRSEVSWQREPGPCVFCSRLSLTIRDPLPPGEYRVSHRGLWAYPWGISGYQGRTSPFRIAP